MSKQALILVPANYGIEPECERGLGQLERRGYAVWRAPGFAAIDQCRNQLASDALACGFEELMWIDADIAFDPEAVDRLRGRNLPIVAGFYPKKSKRSLSSRLFSTTKEVVLGTGGGLIEILYAAGGFLYTRREVYEAIQRHWNLPVCNEGSGKPMVPYFWPMVVEEVWSSRSAVMTNLTTEREEYTDTGSGAGGQGDASPSPAFDKLTAGRPSPVPSASSGPAVGEGEEVAAAPLAGNAATSAGTQRVSFNSPLATPPLATAAKRHSYLAEDFAFSYRARAAGFKIMADTTIRLGHIGPYAYSWEEAGGSNQRFGTYVFRVLDAPE